MRTLTVNGHAMAYAEAGEGEPLVLVHGSLQDQRYWAPQMAAFGARFRTIAVSLRHYWPERWDGRGGDFTIGQHVEDVAAFIRVLHAGPVRLVGHSRGGHIAFRVAELYPSLLRDVVLAEPGGELDVSLGGRVTEAGKGPQAEAFTRAAELVRAGEVEEGLRAFAAYTGGPGAWERRPEARRQIARDNAVTLLGQINEQRAPFTRDSAEAIRTRTLLVNGAQTQPNFVSIIEALETAIQGVERLMIPAAAHAMSADNPAAFNEAVLRWLCRT